MDFNGLDFDMSIKIIKGTKIFGPGMVTLLENVEQYKSLNKATAQMGMAYSKAWKIIKNSESKLGVSLLERKTGGAAVVPCCLQRGDIFWKLIRVLLRRQILRLKRFLRNILR